jgi:polyisoprenoid-binding protein YceI
MFSAFSASFRSNSIRSLAALLLIGLLCLAIPLQSWAQRVSASVDSTASVIDYTGSATMHDWTGTSREVSGALVLNVEEPDSSRALIRAPVASFESGPDRRDRNMREVTEASRYPMVTFQATDIRSTSWGRSSDGHAGRWQVTGDLTFHGQTHPVDATVDVRVTDDSVHAHAQFPVSLTRFGVERPELLWVAPIADTIRIDARVSGAINERPAAVKRLDTTRNETTNTRRISSTDLRTIPATRYAGTRAGLHTAVQMSSDGPEEWAVSLYGFADQPAGFSDAPEIVLRADGRLVRPRRTTGTTRKLENGKTVEIVQMYVSRSAFETLANALTVSATVGTEQFTLPWKARQDLRLLLEKVNAASQPVAADGGE